MTQKRLKTPKLALGTWAWGDSGAPGDGYFGSPMSRDGLNNIAEAAHAAGFNLWDTAVVYGTGRSETVLGEVLSRFARQDYQLSTKFTPQAAGPGDDPMAEINLMPFSACRASTTGASDQLGRISMREASARLSLSTAC